jgi:hypothetical protein
MEVHGAESINLVDVLEGRRNREAFHWFLDTIGSKLVRVSVFEQVKCVQPPSVWLSPSLEAFGLLCVENYFERTKSKVNKEEMIADAKWTSEGRGSKRNRGWKQEGIRRYNVLLEKVRIDRGTLSKEDSVYLSTKLEERKKYEGMKLKKKEEEISNRERGMEAANDDFSSSDNDSDSDSDSEAE